MRQLAQLKDTASTWRTLEKKVSELADLVEMAAAEGDQSLEGEINSDIAAVEKRLGELEFQLVFSGEYDRRGAILAIHAGAGGTESQDWAEMLQRMYLRWAERRRYQSEIVDTSPGEEAGIKSATIEIKGDLAYGYLKGERGVHRLVRISPFDASHSRHTSFALVEVMPLVESDVDVKINPDDIKVEAFRSSGPGGQHMQKTDSAVRITHLPTGVVVACQDERSQIKNKAKAMRVLRARILESKIEAEAKKLSSARKIQIGTGDRSEKIRTYNYPDRRVTDHRINFTSFQLESIMEGEFDEFTEALLKAAEEKAQ